MIISTTIDDIIRARGENPGLDCSVLAAYDEHDMYNGEHLAVRLSLPYLATSPSNKMVEGQCGDFDGNKNNDHAWSGVSVVPAGITFFGQFPRSRS